MKQINYAEIGEHFSSNVCYYDKKKQAKIAKKEFLDKCEYLLGRIGEFLENVLETVPIILAIFAIVCLIVTAIVLVVAVFVFDTLSGIIFILLCLVAFGLPYIIDRFA